MLIGILVGSLGTFALLLAMSYVRPSGRVSSVTVIDEQGRKTVQTAVRKPQRTGGRDGHRDGENSIVATGENVHAVIQKGA